MRDITAPIKIDRVIQWQKIMSDILLCTMDIDEKVYNEMVHLNEEMLKWLSDEYEA